MVLLFPPISKVVCISFRLVLCSFITTIIKSADTLPGIISKWQLCMADTKIKLTYCKRNYTEITVLVYAYTVVLDA